MAAAMMNTELEAVDFDSDDDDLMDEDAGPEPSPVPAPRLRSTIAGGGGGPRKTKGRGFREDANHSAHQRNSLAAGRPGSDSLASDGGAAPVRSIEGWIVLVTGVNEEAQEEDLHNIFGEFGQVKNLHLNLDRRTGYVKGYALIEYENFEEAQAAIKRLDGTELLQQIINADWAFSNGPVRRINIEKRFLKGRRSRSPPRRRY